MDEAIKLSFATIPQLNLPVGILLDIVGKHQNRRFEGESMGLVLRPKSKRAAFSSRNIMYKYHVMKGEPWSGTNR